MSWYYWLLLHKYMDRLKTLYYYYSFFFTFDSSSRSSNMWYIHYLQLQFIAKMILRVHSKASNLTVKGELGRYPLHVI